MTEWNDCLQVEVGSQAYDSMQNHIGHEPIHRVWYQEETDRIFGLDLNWKNIGHKESLLTNTRRCFQSNPRCVIPVGEIEKAMGVTTFATPEVVMSRFHDMDRFHNTRILIVGAGPTTNLVDWNPDNYDHIWSCNHFFLNEKVFECKPSLVTLCEEVSLDNPELLRYIDSNPSCAVGFDQFNSIERIKQSKRFISATNSFFSWTRCQGKIGAITRLISLAVELGATEIHTVGFDGHEKGERCNEERHDHAFEPRKKLQGTYEYNLYLRHFVMFWDYALWLAKNTKFQNLGEGYSMNMSTDISRQEFPLRV
tara:strand:- start:98 stop:1027 length:930 start_codon:yes stop_codon:yes gene_type:complete